ncbi:MAG: hypothetical protein WEC15_02860, partial [Flavobacteriales bacterium]
MGQWAMHGNPLVVWTVRRSMLNSRFRIIAALGAWSLAVVLCAQSDDRVAYVPARAVPHTADSEAMGFRSTAVPGVLEMALPT